MKIQAVRLIISVFLPVVLSSEVLGQQHPSLEIIPDSSTVVVASGWNMISLPVIVSDNRVSALFPMAISRAFAYEYSYQQKAAMDEGTGYWLKFAAPETINISGTAFLNGSISLNSGWNMIGGISAPIAVNALATSPGGIITSKYFTYQNGTGYILSDTLKPGFAYWAKASRSGTLMETCWVPPSQALVSPADGLGLMSAPVLRWRRSACLTQYRLQIADDSLFQTLVTDTVVTDSFYHSTLRCGTPEYFWRVGVGMSPAMTVWSTTRKYQMQNQSLTQLTPPDKSGESLTPQFRWTTNCAGTYRLQLSLDSLLTTMVLDTLLTDTIYQPNPLDSAKDYWWRVGIEQGTQTTQWSPIRSFSATWRFIGLGQGSVSAMAADPLDSTIMYVATSGSIFKTTDAGITWQNLVQATSVLEIDVNPDNSQIIYAAMFGYGIIKSTDGGNSWSHADSGISFSTGPDGFVGPTNLAIDPMYPDTIYAGSEGNSVNATIYKSVNGGHTWFSLYRNGDSLLTNGVSAISVDPESTNIVYAGTDYGDILKTTDGGNSWQWIGLAGTTGGNDEITDILVGKDTSRTIYAGTWYGHGLYVSSDGGNTWMLRDSTVSLQHLSSVRWIVGSPFSHNIYTSASTTTGWGIYQLGNDNAWKKIGFNNAGWLDCMVNHNTLFIGWYGVYKYLR